MWDGKGVFEELPVAPREALGATDAVAHEEDDDEAALAPVADGLDEPEELAEKSGELDVLGEKVGLSLGEAELLGLPEREAADVPLTVTVLHAEAEPEGLGLPLPD